MEIKEKDLDAFAEKLIQRIQKKHHDFWIDGERHYNQHQIMEHLDVQTVIQLKEMVRDYRSVRSTGMKIFFGLVATGAIALAFLGLKIK